MASAPQDTPHTDAELREAREQCAQVAVNVSHNGAQALQPYADPQGDAIVRNAMATATLAAAMGDGTIGGELSLAKRRAIFWRVLEHEMCKAKADKTSEGVTG